MDDNYTKYLDDYDDPYRKCHSCELSHYEENGKSCDICDEWYCLDCFNHEDHIKLHNEKL